MAPLSALQPVHKALAMCLIVAVGLVWLSGELLLLRDYQLADGEPGLSIKDAQLRFTGNFQSLLEQHLQTDMRQYLQSSAELSTLLSWARAGATSAEFTVDVAPLLAERCARCHHPGGEAAFRPLSRYADLRAVAHAPPGPSPRRMLLVTKVHLFGLGLLLAVAALLFAQTPLPQGLKVALVSVGYCGLFMDFGAWWLMRVNLAFAWGRAAGNALFSGALVIILTVSFISLWLGVRRKSGSPS